MFLRLDCVGPAPAIQHRPRVVPRTPGRDAARFLVLAFRLVTCMRCNKDSRPSPVLRQVESLELRTNVVAAYVAGGRSWEVPAAMDAMQSAAAEGYELAFNRACALVEQRDYAAAEQQLQLALRSGVLTFTNEASRRFPR